MAFCGKCGTQLHEGATFCANCGASTDVTAQGAAGAAPVLAHHAVVNGGQRGFWGSLFDLSFTNYVTLKVIKVLFVAAIVFVVIGAIFAMVSAGTIPGFQQAPAAVLVVIVPIAAFLYILLIRIYMEIITVTFRMVEYLRELVEQGRNRG